jgi:uncharacterized protein
MNRPMSPADVVLAVAAGSSRLVAGSLDRQGKNDQVDRLADLYADRTDVRHPFAPLGDNPLLSRAELRRHFAAGPAQTEGVKAFEPTGTLVHQTADPEVVIVEYRYVGSTEDRVFDLPCIFVVRVREGVIVESRDYVDHVGLARAFGRLGDLATALAAEAAGA